MKKHELKTVQPSFHELQTRQKTFEIRKNDRGFKIGDLLILREYNAVVKGYTGEYIERRISYIFADERFGLQKGFVILGLRPYPPDEK